MKVAVCLSGLTRGVKFTVKDIIKYLVEPYDADLFVHTWDIESGGGRAANRFKAVSDNWKTQDEKISFFTNHLNKEKNYSDYSIEAYEDQEWNYLKADIEGSTITPASYSWYRSNEIKKTREKELGFKYDIVIRSRMDSLYEEEIPSKEINQCLENDKLIFVSTSLLDVGEKAIRNSFWFEPAPKVMPFVADNFAFGSSSVMDTYCSLYPNILNIKKQYNQPQSWGKYKVYQPPPPECLLGLLLKNNNILTQRSSLEFMRLVELGEECGVFEKNYQGTLRKIK